MVVYIFEFDIVPGREEDFFTFMKEEGAPFWLQFPEIKKYEIYSKLGGHAAYEARVEMDNFAFLDKMYAHPQAAVCAKKTSSMTVNIQRRLMQLHRVYE